MKMASVLAVVAGAAFANVASAVVVYSQPLDSSQGGIFSAATSGAWYDEYLADNFALSGAALVNGVRWWGYSEFFNQPDYTNMPSFQVEIYSDNGSGLPGTLLHSSVSPSSDAVNIGVSPSGGIQYQHEVSFANLNLGAGTYHVAIGAFLTAGADDNWLWNRTGLGFGDNISGQLPVGGAWASFPGFGDMAFEILAVPAPSALALLGVAGLVARRRR